MVGLRILIGSDGGVRRIAVVHSIPALDRAAITCVSQWKFTPARRQGRPAPAIAAAPVSFRIFDDPR